MTTDLVIVGAGPTGITAALLARGQALEVTILEAAEHPGGQLHRVYGPLTGVPGFSGNGAALAAQMDRQLAEAGIEVRRHSGAVALSEADAEPGVVLGSGERIAARAALIATGLRNRSLGIPGEREFFGRGVSTSAMRDRKRHAGKVVVVVGGGDAAFEDALLLAAAGCSVTVVVRGEPRARRRFRERVAADRKIQVVENARLTAIQGEHTVEAVRIATTAGERALETEAVFVKIGQQPNTELCGATLARDDEGHLRVDEAGATSRPGFWAAGDVTGPRVLTVAAGAAGATYAVNAICSLLQG